MKVSIQIRFQKSPKKKNTFPKLKIR